MAIAVPWIGTSLPGATTSASAASVAVDVSGAANYELVFVAITIADSQASPPTAPTGWTMLQQTSEGTSGGSSSLTMLLSRVKQPGDGSFTFTWPTANNYQATPFSYPGVDYALDSPNAAAHTSGANFVNTAATVYTNAWAVQVCGVRSTTAARTFTPDAAMTERSDVCSTTNRFAGIQISDSNAAVTAASHTYTSVLSASESHGGSILFYLVPGPRSALVLNNYQSVDAGDGMSVTEKVR